MRKRWWYLLSLLVLAASVVTAVWIVKDPIDDTCRAQFPCDVSGVSQTAWRLGVLIGGVLVALLLAAVGAIAGAEPDDGH